MEKNKEYKPRKNSIINKEDAQILGSEFDRISEKNKGELKPNIILNEAKNSKSPLHKYFEWDNSVAGEKYRIWQARYYMGAIVEVVVIDNTPMEQRSFFNVKNDENKQVYVTLETVRKTPSYLQQLIDNVLDSIDKLSITLKLLKSELNNK